MTPHFNRREAIFWGDFIKVAVGMYAPGVINPSQPANFPNGWRLDKNIVGTANVGFSRQKEFLGFLAQSLSNPKQYAFVFHGTKQLDFFLEELEFQLIPSPMSSGYGKVEKGITRIYESMLFIDPKSGDMESIRHYLRNSRGNRPSYTVAGHSLGGALATIHGAILAEAGFPVTVYSLASPMIGDQAFVNTYNQLVAKSYRIVNIPDIVPKLPGELLGYEHVKGKIAINSLKYPEIKHDLSCYHDLATYLYVLGARQINLRGCRA